MITGGLGGGYEWGSRRKPCGDGKVLYLFPFLLKRKLFTLCIYFSAVRGLRCCMRALSLGDSWSASLVAVLRLLPAVTFLVAEHELPGARAQ